MWDKEENRGSNEKEIQGGLPALVPTLRVGFAILGILQQLWTCDTAAERAPRATHSRRDHGGLMGPHPRRSCCWKHPAPSAPMVLQPLAVCWVSVLLRQAVHVEAVCCRRAAGPALPPTALLPPQPAWPVLLLRGGPSA